ncbi:hypothetical protein Xen7305DRAFT_00036610, partial [Xenococcus sp. PCC 7305]
ALMAFIDNLRDKAQDNDILFCVSPNSLLITHYFRAAAPALFPNSFEFSTGDFVVDESSD